MFAPLLVCCYSSRFFGGRCDKPANRCAIAGWPWRLEIAPRCAGQTCRLLTRPTSGGSGLLRGPLSVHFVRDAPRSIRALFPGVGKGIDDCLAGLLALLPGRGLDSGEGDGLTVAGDD